MPAASQMKRQQFGTLDMPVLTANLGLGNEGNPDMPGEGDPEALARHMAAGGEVMNAATQADPTLDAGAHITPTTMPGGTTDSPSPMPPMNTGQPAALPPAAGAGGPTPVPPTVKSEELPPFIPVKTSPHLEDMQRAAGQIGHHTLKQNLLRAITAAAPVALGAAFGGKAGAAGAAQGSAKVLTNEQARDMHNQDLLVREMENERNRIEQENIQNERIRATEMQHRMQREMIASNAPPTKTVMTENGPVEMMWNRKTGAYDTPVGPPAKGSRYDVKVLDKGQVVVRDQFTNRVYDPKDPNAPPDIKAAAQPYLSAHAAQLKEDIDKEGRVAARGATRINITQDSASYKLHQGRIDKLRTPVDSQMDRISRLETTLNQNSPQADSLVAPELLTAMAGGQGSGLRMNEAEIARIVGGRDKWQSLKAAAEAYHLDPTKPFAITPEQRVQIHSLVGAMKEKLATKQGIMSAAEDELAAAKGPVEHRHILNKMRRDLEAVDNGQGQQDGQGGQGNQPQQAPKYKVGDSVTLRNGTKVTIKNVYPDGSFD